MKKNLLKTFWILCITLGFSFSAMAQDITVADFEGDDFGSIMDSYASRPEGQATIVADVTNAANNCVKFMRDDKWNGMIALSNFPEPINLYTHPVISLKVMAGTDAADAVATGKKVNVTLVDIYGTTVSITHSAVTPATIETWSDAIEFDFSDHVFSSPISLIKTIQISADNGNTVPWEVDNSMPGVDVDAVYYFDDIVIGGTGLSFDENTVFTLYEEGTNNNFGYDGDNPYVGTVADCGLFVGGKEHYYEDDIVCLIYNWATNNHHTIKLDDAEAYNSFKIKKDITGKSSFEFTYLYTGNFGGAAPLLQYKVDGGSWNDVTVTTGTDLVNVVFYENSGDLSAASGDLLDIRFSAASGATANIDNLKLSGKEVYATGISITGASQITGNDPVQLSSATLPSNANQTAYWYISDGTEFATIDGNTGEITPLANGTIEVTVVAIDKKATTSDTHSVVIGGVTTDINSLTQEDVTIYPNPIKEVLNIDCDEQVTQVAIYDVAGKFVSSVLNTNQVNTSELTKGVYFVKIYAGNDVIVKKVIKK